MRFNDTLSLFAPRSGLRSAKGDNVSRSRTGFALDSRRHWRYRPATRPKNSLRSRQQFRVFLPDQGRGSRVDAHGTTSAFEVGPVREDGPSGLLNANGQDAHATSWGLWRGKDASHNVEPDGTSTGGGFLRGLVLPVTIIGAILVFVVPIPPAVLDVLLSANLTRGGGRALDDAGDPHAAGIQRVSRRSC